MSRPREMQGITNMYAAERCLGGFPSKLFSPFFNGEDETCGKQAACKEGNCRGKMTKELRGDGQEKLCVCFMYIYAQILFDSPYHRHI